jgi:hypothetical protein
MPDLARDFGHDDEDADAAPGTDTAGMAPGGSGLDPTGLTELVDIMVTVRQVTHAARLAGFSPAEAFELGIAHYTTMLKMSIEANRG